MSLTLEKPSLQAEQVDEKPRPGGTRRLGVAMLIHRFYPHLGGAETQLQSLIPHLRSNNADVHVITRREPGTSRDERIGGADVHRIGVSQNRAGGSLSYTINALNYIARHRNSIDVVHAHGLLSPTTTAVLAKLAFKVPVVVTTHGFQADLALLRDGLLGTQRLRAFARLGDRFVVISKEIGQGLHDVGVPVRKLIAIPHGIDTDRFRPPTDEEKRQARAELGLGRGPVVVYVGRLEPVKGPGHLLDAWRQVNEQVPAAQLMIVGDGSERRALTARLTPGVRFEGAQPDPGPYYRAADLYVLPSFSEGLPVALMEAVASGLTPISTAVGGAPEILEGYDQECLIPPGDVEALGEAMVRALRAGPDQGMLDVLRERMVERYSIQQSARRLVNLYAELTHGTSGP